MTFIIKKLKVCPECENKQEVSRGDGFRCEECGCVRSQMGINNYFKLRTEFLADDFVEKFNKDAHSGDEKDFFNIKRAVENYEEEN